MNDLTKRVRARTWCYLEPCVAAVAGMTIFELQRFISGGYHPTDDQIRRLARRMSIQ
jgi:hypothetical protein